MTMTVSDSSARSIYNDYIDSISANVQGTTNKYTKQYLDAIFESAAGPDGALNKEEAEAVQGFLKQKGAPKKIGFLDAKRLAEQWQTEAVKYLLSITQFDEIKQGFDRVSAELANLNRDTPPQDIECYFIKVAVLFNRISKGSVSLGQNTPLMINERLNSLMTMYSSSMPASGSTLKFGEFCLNLLDSTSKGGTKKEIHNSFIDKHFPGNMHFPKLQ